MIPAMAVILRRPARQNRSEAVTKTSTPPQASADVRGGAPCVIYIAGSGRSGSTLLERVLGQLPGFVNVGELIDLFRRVTQRGERCGCGETFTSCPFWVGVGERAFGGWEDDRLAAVQRLQGRVARQRHMPRLLAMRLAGRGFGADVAAYGAIYASLYQAIAAQARAECVVDASKWPVQALALARAGIDVRVVHLVRDVRGVAHSLGKQQLARPHAPDRTEFMWRNAPAGAAARWLACQGQAELLRRSGLPVTRVRYEDFVSQPARTVEAALAELGRSPAPSHLAHIGDGQVVLGRSHGLSGNPSRFSDGEIPVRADEAWRDQMRRRDRIIVTAIGLPLLLRYGWRPRGRPVAVSRAPAMARQAGERAAWPLVSVIMPTRGRPEMVRESIAAVVAQTYPGDIECIVVHDQEPPNEELERLGTACHRVRVVTNSRTPGLAGARNTALELARGDYIATCDDDDVWHLDKLQFQVARLLDEPKLLAVGSGIRLRRPGNEILDWPGRAERISYELLLRNRVKELHSSTLLMRREAFTRAGCYDEKLPYGYAEDYDWVLRVAREGGRIGLVTRPLADIRRGSGSWYQGGAEKVAAGLEYLLAKHPDIAASRRGHARLLGQIAFARSSLGQRGPALRYAVRSLARWPASPYPYIALVHTVTRVHPRHLLRAARLVRREMA
jgi:hypothetical protein